MNLPAHSGPTHGDDLKVRRVSSVHDNMFGQTTVVNHLQAPPRIGVVQVNSWRAADG